MRKKNKISLVTRKDLFYELKEKEISWYGRLDEIQFLNRLYDLKKYTLSIADLIMLKKILGNIASEIMTGIIIGLSKMKDLIFCLVKMKYF